MFCRPGETPLFLNRLLCAEFLRGYLDCPKSEGILDKSIYTVLRCNEFTGLLSANVLWKFIFNEPFRWLSGKTSKLSGWSLYKMSEVADQIEKALVEIEAEAIIGSADDRQTIYTENQAEKARGYARAVRVGDVVHVSGCTSIDADRNVRAVGDWAGQYDLAHKGIEAALKEAGAMLGDVVRRRTFTIDPAEQNRPYGEGPPWFKESRPVSLGCRISGLADPEMLVEVDAMAVIGASQEIEWLSLAE